MGLQGLPTNAEPWYFVGSQWERTGKTMQESRGPLERARRQSPLQASGVRFRARASLCQLLEDASCLSALISPWDGLLGPKHVPEISPTLPVLLLSVVEPSADFFEGPVSSPQLYSNCLQQKGIGEVLGNSFNMATPALGTTRVSGELACRPGWGSVPYSRQDRAVLWALAGEAYRTAGRTELCWCLFCCGAC